MTLTINNHSSNKAISLKEPHDKDEDDDTDNMHDNKDENGQLLTLRPDVVVPSISDSDFDLLSTKSYAYIADSDRNDNDMNKCIISDDVATAVDSDSDTFKFFSSIAEITSETEDDSTTVKSSVAEESAATTTLIHSRSTTRKKTPSSSSTFKSIQRSLRRYNDPARALFELCHRRRPKRYSYSSDDDDIDRGEQEEEEKKRFWNDIYWDFHHLLQCNLHVIHSLNYYDPFNIHGYNALHAIFMNPDLANHQLLIQLFIDTSISHQEEIEENEANNSARSTFTSRRIQNQRRRKRNEQRRLEFLRKQSNEKELNGKTKRRQEEGEDSLTISHGKVVLCNELQSQHIQQQPTAARILHQKSTKTGEVPLHVACKSGFCSVDTIELILSHYPASACIPDRLDSNFPLHLVCSCCCIASHHIIDDNATVEDKEEIMKQYRRNSLLIMKTLMEQWPDSCQIPNRDGNIPLHLAAQCITNVIIANMLSFPRRTCTRAIENEDNLEENSQVLNGYMWQNDSKKSSMNHLVQCNTMDEVLTVRNGSENPQIVTSMNHTSDQVDNSLNESLLQDDRGNPDYPAEENDYVVFLDYLLQMYPEGKRIQNRNGFTPHHLVISLLANDLHQLKQLPSFVKSVQYPVLCAIISRLRVSITTNSIAEEKQCDDVGMELTVHRDSHLSHSVDVQNEIVATLDNLSKADADPCHGERSSSLSSNTTDQPFDGISCLTYQNGCRLSSDPSATIHDSTTISVLPLSATNEEIDERTNKDISHGAPSTDQGPRHRFRHHHVESRKPHQNGTAMHNKSSKCIENFDVDEKNSTASNIPCVELLDIEIGISNAVISKINSHFLDFWACDDDDLEKQ